MSCLPHSNLDPCNSGLVFTSNTSDDGAISKDEFEQGLKRLGVKISKAECDLIWPYFDTDNR